MTAAVVQGLLSGYRTTVDGGLKLTIELDELQAAHFHEAFTGINLLVAVARLNDGEVERASEE